MLFKVGEKGSIRQVLEMGSVVCHSVGVPWEESGKVVVAVLTLVVTSYMA